MSIKTNTPYATDIADIVRAFNCDGEITHSFNNGKHISTLNDKGSTYSYIYDLPVPENADNMLSKKLIKRGAKICVYRTIRQRYGDLPWGSLTGVRPTKFFRELAAQFGQAQAERMFSEDFNVSPGKLALTKSIFCQQSGLIDISRTDLYVGIPVCRTRCAYCSFAATTIDKIDENAYADALLKQISELKPLLKNISAVYIGGGTPTVLSTKNLTRVLTAVSKFANGEFSLEAGRPDSITPEKLKIIRDFPVTRLSINPQTIHDETLRKIGRSHTAADFFTALELARKAGFNNINCDLILGLPGEDIEMFAKSVYSMVEYNPESVTVHALSVKHGSAITTADLSENGALQSELSGEVLGKAGYAPYYMYRQKYMTGNLENTGYTLPGHACRYNIDIMEETANIIAVGAGGISKRIFSKEPHLKRAPQVKDVKGYIERNGEMTARITELFG